MTLESKDDQDPLDHVVVPLHEEQVSIGKREVDIDRVKVSTVTHSRKELVEQLLRKERVEIERVPMGQVVQEVPQEEGDVTIIPVVEETVFVVHRLVLRVRKYESAVFTKRKSIRNAWYCAGRKQRLPVSLRQQPTSHPIGCNIAPPERGEIRS